AAQSNRLAGQLGPGYFRSRRSRVALVKDEIDDLKHRVQPLRQFLRRRHLVWNWRLSNLCLGAYDALGERRRRHEKCAGDLFRGQAADFAKGERNLSLRRQSGMAAGEDQTEAIVLDLFISSGSVVDARFHVGNKISLCAVEARAPTDYVDGLEACR